VVRFSSPRPGTAAYTAPMGLCPVRRFRLGATAATEPGVQVGNGPRNGGGLEGKQGNREGGDPFRLEIAHGSVTQKRNLP